MTNNNGMEAVSSPLKSKKFLAFMAAEISWKVVMICVLFWGRDAIPQQVWLIMLTTTLIVGFVEVAYIAGQAALDRYVRVAQIAANVGKNVTMKGISIGGQEPTPKPEPEPKPPQDG